MSRSGFGAHPRRPHDDNTPPLLPTVAGSLLPSSPLTFAHHTQDWDDARRELPPPPVPIFSNTSARLSVFLYLFPVYNIHIAASSPTILLMITSSVLQTRYNTNALFLDIIKGSCVVLSRRFFNSFVHGEGHAPIDQRRGGFRL